MIKLFLSLLLLLLFVNNNIVYGYVIKDVSKIGTVYKTCIGKMSACVFNIDILCSQESASESCTSGTIPITYDTSQVIATSNLVIDNGTASVSAFTFSTNIGQHLIYYQDSFSINLECIVPDFSTISIALIGNEYSYFMYSTPSVIGEFSISGLASDISIGQMTYTLYGVDNNNCVIDFIPAIDQLLKKIILKCYQIPTNNDEKTPILQIESSTSSNNFTLTSINKVFNDQPINSVSIYPEYQHLSNLPALGYGFGPVLSFTFDSQLNDCYFKLEENGNDIDNIRFLPIHSNETSTTVLIPLTINEQPVNYQLYYYQSGDYKKVASTFQATLFPYPTYSLNAPTLASNNGEFATWRYTEVKNYYFNQIKITVNALQPTSTNFPFGYTTGGPNSYTFEVSTPIKTQYYKGSQSSIQLTSPSVSSGIQLTFSPSDVSPYIENQKPLVLNIEKFYLDNGINLLRITIKTPYKFNYFVNQDGKRVGSESRVSGNELQGVYEIRDFKTIKIYDQPLNSISFSYNAPMFIDKNQQVVRNYISPILPNLNLYSIKQVSFLNNNIDITHHRVFNIFYFNFTDEIPRDTIFEMVEFRESYNTISSNTFISKWNDTIKLFQIEFYIDGNGPIGVYKFILSNNDQYIYSNNLDVELNIIKSNMDNQGPIFKEIKLIPMTLVTISLDESVYEFGWSMVIEDLINGFDWGYIIVYGESDHSRYNVTISSKDVKLDGNRYLGEYDIKIQISINCVLQYYSISQVKLFDSMGKLSYFSILQDENQVGSIQYSSALNPFLEFIYDKQFYSYSTTSCPGTIGSNFPELLSFEVSPSTLIDVSKASRVVNFKFTARSDYGMKYNQYPIVYISDSNNQILECKSNYSKISNAEALYQCSIELSLGFGYPGKITFSVYGFQGNDLLYSGYSTVSLMTKGFPYYLDTTFTTNDPVLNDYMLKNERGGNLWLYGRGFDNTILAYITYSDGSSATTKPTRIYPTAMLIPNIKATTKEFNVYISKSSSINSNTLKVKASTIYDFYNIDCNGNGLLNSNGQCICNSKWTSLDIKFSCTIPNHYISTTTQVSAETGGEIEIFGWFGDQNNNPLLYIDNKVITNFNILSNTSIKTTIGSGNLGPIQLNYTQNNIIWSGIIYPYLNNEKECPTKCEINGKCNKTIGLCICNIGFTGLDCSINSNNNNNNNNGGGGSETQINNNGSTIIKNEDGIGYLISIDSIVELDINNNIVSRFNLLNNWIYENKTNSITRFIQKRNNQDNTESIIGLVIEEVNEQDKEFEFAGNQFTVLKGGFKLSLSISNWLYNSNLNVLQLLMSSDIQIDSSNNKCNNNNNNAIIESSSNNNYLSNNINYLKIINNNRALYARFQDKMLADNRSSTVLVQLLSNSNLNNSNIKVGITLPRCDECLIDPDFSLLITSDYKFECKESKKWVLTVAVVVSVGGALIILISLYLVYRKSTMLKIKLYSIKKRLTIKN